MDYKQFLEHELIIADDISDQEKFEALEALEVLDEIHCKIIIFESIEKDDFDHYNVLVEVQGDDDIAAYTKYRNKMKKIGGQTPVDKTGKKLKYVAKKKKAAKAGKGWGAKIASKIKAAKASLLKKAAASPKVMKAAKLASKLTM